MADISLLSRLVAGASRNVDLSSNTLVVSSIKVGGGVSNTEFTKTILDRLVSLQDGSDVDSSYHTHDSRYFTETELSATSGSTLIGDDNTSYSNFTPSAATVRGALEGIDSALASAGATPLDGTFVIENTSDPTKKMAFDASAITTGTTRTLKMANADVDLAALTNSNISASAAIAYSKLSLAGSIVNADVSSSAAIAYSKLSLSASIVNADISSSAAIAYSKLSLSSSIVNSDISASAAIALSKLAALSSHNRVLVSDSSGLISESSVTTTTLGYLDATSSIQTQLNAKVDSSSVGSANGVASLDSGGKVPVSQLPNSIMEYQGVWDASTNTPTLSDFADGTAAAEHIGDVYRVSVAGSQDLGSGSITYAVGDYAILNSDGKWEKSHSGADTVVSVNGQAGIVSLSTSDISEGSNLYFTDERAQDAVGAMVADSSKVSLTYVDGTPSLTADIVAGSLVNADISSGAAIDYSKLALTGSIVNADVSSSAAIAYSKLSLAASIVNSDISASAAIAYSKLSLSASIVNADISASAAIAYSKLALNNSIVAGDLTANSVTAAKINSSAFDQSTITGGGGSAAAVQSAPLAKRTMVAGQSFAANTTFAVRFALTGETAGRVYKADKDATSSANYMAIGLVMPGSSVSTGGNIDVVMLGEIAQGSSDTPWSSSDVGKELFLGSSGAIILGASLANTTNEAQFCLGVVKSTTSVWVDFKQLRGIA